MSQIEKALIPISIIICTYNRASYLKLTLESLTVQTLDKQDYEIVVIDDGSSDNTREIVGEFFNRLPIEYFYQENAGLASSKNHGIYAAQGKVLLFLDDDDIATPTLLKEHLKTHHQYPDDFYAVLNYTTWSPNLNVTPLMHFITEEGCFLFSYPYIKYGDILDYTNFWGGRTSCKRSFLIEHGVFNPVFRFGCEDVELGYRLAKHNLKVVYNSQAISMMVRPLTFDHFCNRLIKQGRSQYVFSTLHNDPEVLKYAEIIDAEVKWSDISQLYDAKMRSARELDSIANMKLESGFEFDDLTKRLLHDAYWWVFKACKIKGIAEAKKESKEEIYHETGSKSINSRDDFQFEDAKSSLKHNAAKQKNATHQFETFKVTTYGDYLRYAIQMKSEYKSWEQYESSLVIDTNPFTTKGYCFVCKQKVEFSVDYSNSYKKNGLIIPNFRKHLFCPSCGLNNRMRASIHLFEILLKPNKTSKIYITEQTTPIYNWFMDNYENVFGSEYLHNSVSFGEIDANGLRNESLTELSFNNNQFDFILSFEVFEYIPDFRKAFKECIRVLKPNGKLFFTVPFERSSETNFVRAVMKDEQEIEHILPPEYHGDPLNSEGCLSFYVFGWEMLKQLKEINFTDVNAHLYWSKEFGYLGGVQTIFVAEKKNSEIHDTQVLGAACNTTEELKDSNLTVTAREKNQKYDMETVEVMKRILNKESNCVDIGCHVGSFMREIIQLAPKGLHYAFEPIPELFNQLTESFKSYPNVKLYGIGLSDVTGESTFQHVISNPAYSGFRRRRYERTDEKIKEIRVKTDRLDNIVRDNAKIDFIKIDVEGAELEVFKGAVETIKKNRPIIVFEHGPGAADYYDTTPGDIYDLLTVECGLKISLMERWLIDKTKSSFEKDEFIRQFDRGENFYYIAHP